MLAGALWKQKAGHVRMSWLPDKPSPAAMQKVINHLVAASPGPCAASPHPIGTSPQGRHAPLTQSSLLSQPSETDVLESSEREEDKNKDGERISDGPDACS